MRQHVEQGGRVLWLAERADSQQAYLAGIGIAARHGRGWQGDWASTFTWIRQDQMFQAIPSGGMVDFAFADLIPENVIVGFAPPHFEADVHAGLFVGWLHTTVALVGEQHFGSGRLLISTFQLNAHVESNPVASVMLRDMLEYLTRPAA